MTLKPPYDHARHTAKVTYAEVRNYLIGNRRQMFLNRDSHVTITRLSLLFSDESLLSHLRERYRIAQEKHRGKGILPPFIVPMLAHRS